ncbi:MAG TPA: hypothetical protein VKU01_01045 [Bryobacteraceae bacterium]|nr:hypothetical protein [Bryobacteraceae bacterium]
MLPRHRQPLSPRKRIISLVVMVLALGTILTYNYIVTGPLTKASQARVTQEFGEIKPFPSTITHRVKFGAGRESGIARVTADYCATSSRQAVHDYYNKQLTDLGWLLTRVSSGANPTMTFKKGEDALTLELPNSDSSLYCFNLKVEWER